MKIAVIVLGAVAAVLGILKFILSRNMFKKSVLRADLPRDEQMIASAEKKAGAQGRAYFTEQLNYMRSRPYISLKISASDGVELRGRLYENPKAKSTVLLSHGYRSCGEKDFAAAFRFFYEELSMNVLIPFHRAHGESGGDYVCFGAKESTDLSYWLKGLEGRYGASHKVVLYGVSMGAAACVLCMGAKEKPKNVKAMIVDGSYSSFMEQMHHVIKTKTKLPAVLVESDLWRLCKKKADFDILAIEVDAAAYYLTVPTLFIHGDRDDLVPYSHCDEIFKACSSKKKLVTLYGGVHAASFLTHRELCKTEISAFLKENL